MKKVLKYILISLTLMLSMPMLAGNPVKIGVMLPLHNVDGDGKRMVEYYRGILMACEDLQKQGISTDIHAWNVPNGADIRTTLLQNGANKCDLIIGPLYTPQVAALGEFCKTYNIKMLIPFSINSNEVLSNPNVFQIYQSQAELNILSAQAFVNRFPNAHPIFVDCNDANSLKGTYTTLMRRELEKHHINYNITNLVSPDESFAKAFDRSKQNIIILNSGRSHDLTAIFDKLDRLTQTYPGVVVSLFGYTEWLMYAYTNMERYFKYDVYIPSTFYYNASSPKTKQLEADYQKWFGERMQYALPRFAINGYDQAQFFIRGIYQYGKNFTGSSSQTLYTPLQNRLKFVKRTGGGYKNDSFQLIHYTFNHTIESINY